VGYLLAGLLIPFFVALALMLLLRRRSVVVALGFVLVPIVLFALGYLTADETPGSCSDCGEYLGRWWEPWVIAIFAFVGVATRTIGAGLGGLLFPVRGRSAAA
jgi:hypothetical protein